MVQDSFPLGHVPWLYFLSNLFSLLGSDSSLNFPRRPLSASSAFLLVHPHLPFHSLWPYTPSDIRVCFLSPQLFCTLMAMIAGVLLSGGPSTSLFCPGTPVSQTSIWLAKPSKEPSWPIFFSLPFERILFKSLYRIPGENHLCTDLLVHLLLLSCEHLECRSVPIHLYIPGSGTCVLNEEMNEWIDQSITVDLWLVVVQLLCHVQLFATT